MLIDYSDPDNREEFLHALRHNVLEDFVLSQLRPYFDDTMSPGTQASQFGKVMRYLDEHLVIEFKD